MKEKVGALSLVRKLSTSRFISNLSRSYQYIFIVPALAGFVVFIAFPIGWAGFSSLFHQDLDGRSSFSGLSNYLEILQDPTFWTVVQNMGLWALITIPVQMIVGGLVAWFIEQYVSLFKGFFRALYLIPVVTNVAVIAIIWEQMYAPYYGVLQGIFQTFGIVFQSDFLGSPDTAIFAVIIVNVWEWTGFSMLMYIPAINAIPNEIMESCRLEGAKGFTMARRIIVPMLAPVTKSLLLLGIIGTLQTFPLVYLMTNGGPDHASEVFGTYIFKEGFILAQSGMASALSIIVLLFALILTIVQIRFLGSRLAAGPGLSYQKYKKKEKN